MYLNREALWAIVRERAVMDRMDFLDAWANTGNEPVSNEIKAVIERFKNLKGVAFKDALLQDREGVRLAFHSAECWYEGLFDAQVGLEKKKALSAYKKVREARIKLFGLTEQEVVIKRSVSIPTHKIPLFLESGLTPEEFLAAQQT
jgi:hypothetical protein